MGTAEAIALAVAVLSLSTRARFPTIPHWVSEGGLAFSTALLCLLILSDMPPSRALLLASVASVIYSANRLVWFPKAAQDTRTQEIFDFIDRGKEIQRRYMGTGDGSEIVAEQRQWAQEIAAYLKNRVGEGPTDRFKLTRGSSSDRPTGSDNAAGDAYAVITARISILKEIIEASL